MRVVKHSVCPHDCPDTCGLLVEVENDHVISVRGDPDHPFTRGAVCVKVRHYPERVHSPNRLRHPLKRTGPKGSGSFASISWDDALSEIVNRYQEILATCGGEAILPYSYAGTMGLVHYHAGHPFFHKLGASRLLRTICSAAVEAGFGTSMGAIPTTDIESTVDSDLIILWGTNTLTTNVHAWPFFLKARRRGSLIVSIDPYRNRTAEQADLHLALRPGTDAALALGMMHVLVEEGLEDLPFIAQHTVGFERLIERVKEYPTSKVARITGLSPSAIEDLARKYGRAKAPYIRLGWGPARQLNGGMAARTIALLPALTGALFSKGGGITRSTSAAFGLNTKAVMREDLAPPGVRIVNMVELGKALTELDHPPVKALHVYHSNPAVVAPDSSSVLRGLARGDLFTVVHEHFLTETALYADIVLPAATSLESIDLYRSYGHYYLQMAHPAIAPVGEARPTRQIFQALASRFGFNDPCFIETEEETIRKLLETPSTTLEGITYDRLSEGRPLRLNVPDQIFSTGFATPSGKVEFYSQTLAERGFDPLPDGAPSLDPDGEGRYPLQLITPPRHTFLNSTFNEVDVLREKAGKPTVMMNPLDAASRGIDQGMFVRVYNDRGECFLFAEVTDRAVQGVIVIEGLYWPRHMPGNKGVNQLTSQRLTDMGQSCAFHCNLVEVEVSGAKPENSQ